MRSSVLSLVAVVGCVVLGLGACHGGSGPPPCMEEMGMTTCPQINLTPAQSPTTNALRAHPRP